MTDLQPVLQAVDHLNKELDAIAKQVAQDLNTVAGTERLNKWKTATTAVLKQCAGDRIAGQFAQAKPGRSFTNDMLEEFQDQVEAYRAALAAAVKAIQAQASRGSST